MNARWIRLGQTDPLRFDETCARVAGAQRPGASPIVLWGEGRDEYPFAVIAPVRLAPGKRVRWRSWGLAPAVAAYRQFGVTAYLNDEELWLRGRPIAQSVVKEIGRSIVVASSFLIRFPESCVTTPSRELEHAFRLRLEAQHGWQFEHSWPTRPEMLDYALA
ncbi:MAG TPA: hypothetical protein VEB41_16280 [Burkholderiales bacterium]|nr:hypothetical protein [Burkholderiales bacterium]